MSVKAEFIQLEAGDDAASVRDRLQFHRGQRVVLIWPEEGKALTRKLDLVLIQREAMRQMIRLALVTHDPDVIRHAAELNISTFETVAGSQRRRWKRGRSRVFATRLRRPLPTDPESLMPYASRVRGDDELSTGRRVVLILARALALGALGGVLVAAAILLVPSANVMIMPAQQRVETEATITADPALQQAVVNVEQGIMPATTVRAEIEERGTIPTSGAQELSSTPAIGRVTFINRSSRAVVVPEGALVSTSAGTPIIFRTTEEVTVPAGVGSQADVAIEAIPESAGEVGNVAAGLINAVIGPLAESVEARNFAPTFGGERRTVRLVTAEDRERLIGVLRQQLQDRAYRELAPRVPASQFIIPDTVRIEEERADWMTFDHDVGDVADHLTLTMRAVVAVSAIDETIAQSIAYARLSTQVARGRTIQPETIEYGDPILLGIDPAGRVTFALRASAVVTARVNVPALQERLIGRTQPDALRYLLSELDLAEESLPEITISPEWWSLMPLLPLRINVEVQMPPQPAPPLPTESDV